MTRFAVAVAAVAGAALLGVSAVAFVTAAQPGTTRSIDRLLSAEAGSPSPTQGHEQHNGSGQEPDGTVRSGAAENEACTDNDADEAKDQQGDKAENEQGEDETCTGSDADEAEDRQGMDEHGPAGQSDVTVQR